MYANNELMFPNYVIPITRDMRGEEWRKLVDHVIELSDDHPDKLAFVLAMIQLNGCMECETDSYRAMRGCTACVAQTLRRFKAPDADLLDAYQKALAEVKDYLAEQDGQIRIA